MKRIWHTSWRVALCGLLLLWIFHSIFVDGARKAAPAAEWNALSRTGQWERGWREGPSRLGRTLAEVEPSAFALSLALMGVTIVLGTWRWQNVLRVQGLNLSFGRTIEITLVAHFFNSFLLGSTGGDLMKAYYAARETRHKKTEAVVTVFVDRVIGLWSMLLFAGVMIVANWTALRKMDDVSHIAALMIGTMLVAGTAVVSLAFWGGISKRWTGARAWLRRLPNGEWLERSLDSCRRFGRDRLFMGKAVLISMGLNAVVVLQWWVVGRGLQLSQPAPVLFMVVPVVVCIAALPVTPSGLGVREPLFVHMLENITPSTNALSQSLLAFAGSLTWSLIGGVVYLLFRDRHHLAAAELAPDDENAASPGNSAAAPRAPGPMS